MCGVAGYIGRSRNEVVSSISFMTNGLTHRGPDFGDTKVFESGASYVGLGHRRLAILDLSDAGNQPMRFNGLTITYNGEIYNFKSVRDDLIKNGYSFETDSDTEVLLKSYDCWGSKMCNRLNGMFAFVIFDEKREELIMVRDRLGVKPLFYFNDGERFLFASEMKSILMALRGKLEIHASSVASFLFRGWTAAEQTPVKNILKVKPARFLRLCVKSLMIKEEKRYWHPALDPVLDSEKSYDFANLVEDAVRLRMVSDVEVGCFLSGGIDSALVAAMASGQSTAPLKTFSIKFNEAAFDESDRAKYVASLLGAEHKEFIFEANTALNQIDRLMDVSDDLSNDWSTLPMLLLSEQVSQELKVVLSGDGGDEFFHGYEKYYQIPELFGSPVKRTLQSAISGITCSFVKPFRGYSSGQKIFGSLDYKGSILEQSNEFKALEKLTNYHGRRQQEILFKHDLCVAEPGFVNEEMEGMQVSSVLRLADIWNYLPANILPKVDKTTMAFGLEAREPLLDPRLLEYAISLPDASIGLLRPGKLPLRNLLAKVLPQYPFDNHKKGFSVPLGSWMRKELKDRVYSCFSDDSLAAEPLFNSVAIRNYVDMFLKHGVGNPKFIWGAMIYLQWKKKWEIYSPKKISA
jgi:asparagine synthase (glutamine-hydrolysing)